MEHEEKSDDSAMESAAGEPDAGEAVAPAAGETAGPTAAAVGPFWRRLRWPRHIRSRRGAWLAAAASVVVVGALSSFTWWQTCGFAGCPSTDVLRQWQPPVGHRVLGHDDALLGVVDPVRRVSIPLDSVPAHVQQAFVAVEDRRFRLHNGIDWPGVARSALRNLRAGGIREGASTITMQFARNAFLQGEMRGWRRKVLELRYAGLLERAFSKDELLEHYLNTIYFGSGTWGVEAASRDLFGHGAREVTPAEAAVLAGLPKAPSTYSPRRSLERARARRDVVLGVLVRDGLMDSAQAANIRDKPVRLAKKPWDPGHPAATWALETVRQQLDSLRSEGLLTRSTGARAKGARANGTVARAGVLPTRGGADRVNAVTGDLVVHTTIDVRAQTAAERAVSAGAARLDRRRTDSKLHPTQGALIALDPGNGAIRALVGGRALEPGGFNRALLARRQAGSTFKPFVYAAALANGYTTTTLVDDIPVEVKTPTQLWTPANYGHSYSGRVTMRSALTRSANAATVRISQDIGNAPIIALARASGVSSPLPDVPSLALGSAELTPLELTTAYAVFANGGWKVTPHLLTRVETADGDVLWERPTATRQHVMPETDAFLVTSLLRSVVDNGTGTAVRAAGVRGPVAGKTGTTNDGTDTWFVGYTPSLVAAVWLGADAPRSLGGNATGGRDAAPIWGAFVREGWKAPASDAAAWNPPEGLVERLVDAHSGLLAGTWCGEQVRREWYKPGTEPTQMCEPPEWWDTYEASGQSRVISTVAGWLNRLRRRD